MTVAEYYRHARTLGAFPAVDCLRMAREAATLDQTHRKVTPPAQAWHETIGDDANTRVSLSAGVLVF